MSTAPKQSVPREVIERFRRQNTIRNEDRERCRDDGHRCGWMWAVSPICKIDLMELIASERDAARQGRTVWPGPLAHERVSSLRTGELAIQATIPSEFNSCFAEAFLKGAMEVWDEVQPQL